MILILLILQIENEYGNVIGSYGASGKAYIQWCANMAQSLDVGVPWIMCQQDDAPQPMVIRLLYFSMNIFNLIIRLLIICNRLIIIVEHMQWLVL